MRRLFLIPYFLVQSETNTFTKSQASLIVNEHLQTIISHSLFINNEPNGMGSINMIQSIDDFESLSVNPDTSSARSQRMFNLSYLTFKSGHAYINSEDYDNDRNTCTIDRNFFYTEWTQDKEFSLSQLRAFADVLENYVISYSKHYEDFFPSITKQIGLVRYKDNRRVEGIDHIRGFHKHVENIIVGIHIMRRINILLSNNVIDTDNIETTTKTKAFIFVNNNMPLLFKLEQQKYDESLQSTIHNSNKMGFTGMISSLLTPEKELEQQWLDNDSIYQSELNRLNAIDSLTHNDIAIILNPAKEAALLRKQQHIHQQLVDQQNNAEAFLSEDQIYQSKLKQIETYNSLTDGDRESLYDIAKQQAISRHDKKIKSLDQISQEQANMDVNNSYNNVLQQTDEPDPNLEAFNDFLSRPIQIPHVNQSSFQQSSLPKQQLHRLHRNSDPQQHNESHVTKQSSTESSDQRDSNQPSIQHLHHKRMSTFQLKEFYNLVYQYHQPVYAEVMNYMILAESLLEPRNKDNDEDDYDSKEEEEFLASQQSQQRKSKRKAEQSQTNYLQLENSKNKEEEATKESSKKKGGRTKKVTATTVVDNNKDKESKDEDHKDGKEDDTI